MPALNVQQYQKSLEKAIERWETKTKAAADKLAKINEAIKTLEEQLECATPEGEKQIKPKLEALKKARTKVGEEVEAANLSLKVELMLIEPPAITESNKKDFLKLPGVLDTLVKKGGIPLGKTGVVLKPDIEFDFKKGTLKKALIELKFDW
ncbi:MAG: hypothetical protein ACKVQR_17395 [Aquabacterium sp.]